MKKFEENILDISHNYYKYLLNLYNVNGIGLGYKKINEIETKEICLNVFVDKKLNNKYLSSNNIIPNKYMGIKTDVIETGKFKIKSNKNAIITQKFRPLVGGASISVGIKQGTGTIGCIVVKKKSLLKSEYFILSNNHVLCDYNKIPLGKSVLQPSEDFSGNFPNDVIGALTDFVPVQFSNKNNHLINYVDCAIAKLSNKSLASKKIHQIGALKGISTATLGLNVKKVGFKTGLTEGKIISIGVTKKVDFGKKFLLYQDQIEASLYGDSGDSGSIVLDDKNKAIGLLMGGSEDNLTSTLNDIKLVLDKLNVKIYF